MVKKSVLYTAAILVVVALPASASDTGFYIGAALGQSNIEITDFYPTLGDSLKQSSDSFKAFAGYRFLPFLAVEAGYANLGSPQGLERNVPEHPEVAEVSIKGWDAFVIGILPVSKNFDIFAKAGLYAWDTDITSVQDSEVIYDESLTGTDTAFGGGLGFWVGKNVTLRAEGEWLKVGEYSTVGFYSVGVTYTF